MQRWLLFVSVPLFFATFPDARAGRPTAAEKTPQPVLAAASRLREPVALAMIDGGKTLLVANRKSGSVSVINAEQDRVNAEYDVGPGLCDLAFLPGGRYLLAIAQTAHELQTIDTDGGSIRVVDRIKVSPDPVRLAVSHDGSIVVVASRWSRRLTFIAPGNCTPAVLAPALSILGSVELPFCPLELVLFADGGKVAVADAFGGKLAIIDTKSRTIDRVRSLPAHNIRGLALAPDGRTLVLAHQVIDALAHTSFDDVHWGLTIRNHLRVLSTMQLLHPFSDSQILDKSRLFDLGDVTYAAGDPSQVAYDAHGRLLIALAGVDEVAITAAPGQGPRRIPVGRRPVAVLPSPDGNTAYIANSLDDTIAVVEIATGRHRSTIPLGPRPEPTPADRGERLFTSAKLSHDGWMSCQSCHTDGHTNGLLSDTLGDGSYGAAKRIPSLLGVAATGPWTWTGSITRLEDQITKSIVTTMQGTKPTSEQVADLAAYLTRLEHPPPDGIGLPPVDTNAVKRGHEIFESRKCVSCHAPPVYTSPGRFDVGLYDDAGNHEFNPPSLRGLRLRDAFFHDGRAHAVDDVFSKELHPRGARLTAQEIADLVAFLKTL